MTKWAVIVAGGSGTRMGMEQPKQFIEILGQPVISYTLQKFVAAGDDIKLVVVLPKNHLDIMEDILEDFPVPVDAVVAGGESRFHSVRNGLGAIPGETGLVAIHDAVRPCLSVKLIESCYEAADKFGSAVPVVPVKESVRRITGETSEMIDREQLRIVQTPQVFDLAELKSAYLQPYSKDFTDDASVLENSGKRVHLVEGEPENIKITVPMDLWIAESLLR